MSKTPTLDAFTQKPVEPSTEYTLYRGGSDSCGPCQECGEMMVYEEWDGMGRHLMLWGEDDKDIVGHYKCKNNHVKPVQLKSFD